MRRVLLLAGFAAFGGLACLPGQAQKSGPPNGDSNDANGPPAQVHVNLEAIPVDIVVQDKKKKPVLNLTPVDISVSDGGTPVHLTDMHLVTAQMGGTSSISLVFSRMGPESTKVARAVAARLLAMTPEKCTFAVLGLDRGLRLFQNFTVDRVALTAATDEALAEQKNRREMSEAEKQLVSVVQTGALATGRNVSVEDRARARMMLGALEESQRIVEQQHALSALAGMEALAKSQQVLPGRKVIVFFSEGLQTNSSDEGMKKETVQVANRASVGIYTVDTNAVAAKSFDMLTMMYQPTERVAPRNVAGDTANQPNMAVSVGRVATSLNPNSDTANSINVERDRSDSNGSTLAFLANGTGGFSISGGDKLNEPLQRLVDDVAAYYEASYTPVLKDFDGEFHSLDIQPVRTGLTIRSRAGYFALPPDAAGGFGVRPFEAPLLKTLSEPRLPTEVFFQQQAVRLGMTAGRSTNELAIEVPLSQLELRPDQRTMLFSAHVSILAQVRDKSGVVVERFSQDITRNGALESVDEAKAEVVTLQRHFSVAPGDYVLESAVLDVQGGKAGAQRTEFTIPASPDGPWLSDVTLIRRSEPFRGAPDAQEPMQYAKALVVPNLSRKVPAGTKRISFFFSVHPDAKIQVEGKLDLDVERDGKAVSHTSTAIPAATHADASLNMTSTIESKALAPGEYDATLIYTQGDKSAKQTLEFTVDGTRKAADDDQPEDDAGEDDAAAGTDVIAPAVALPLGLEEFDAGRFTPADVTSGNAPGEKRREALLRSARERAMGYLDSLVNFKCIEVTDVYVDQKGAGTWSRHDKIAEMVTYENQEETRVRLEVNGKGADAASYSMNGARLEGEFGGVLKIVFDPASNAEFRWKTTEQLDGAPVQVFTYRVDAKKSKFSVTALPETPRLVAFHGLVYIDDNTRGVLRITIEAEDIPKESPVHASAVTIDYDYVAINNHDYLMPVRGEMRMRVGRAKNILHRIEFRDYHRFGSQTRIVGFDPEKK